MIPFKYFAMLLKIDRLVKTSSRGDVKSLVNELFKDAPDDVKRVVDLILNTEISGKDPKSVIVEIGSKLGLSGNDLDSFVEVMLDISERIKEYLKAENV